MKNIYSIGLISVFMMVMFSGCGKSSEMQYLEALEHEAAGRLVRSVAMYKKLADEGYAPAQYKLAFCYQNGLGVDKNTIEAVKLFRKSAEQNYSPAQMMLGGMMFHGIGIAENEKEGRQLILKAAEQSNGTACAMLCSMLMKENKFGDAKQWRDRAEDLMGKSSVPRF